MGMGESLFLEGKKTLQEKDERLNANIFSLSHIVFNVRVVKSQDCVVKG